MTYREVPAKIDLPAMEREILAFWQQEQIFAKSLAKSAGGPTWVFYEGPPTANGKPGTHHVEARVFKDVFPRFRTMKGYHVPRKAGWDCHGLPVELAVEKELGFSGKQDIEKYGIAEFNARCRESVLTHVDEFEAMTERMGYWVDMNQAYWTMDADYVDSVWWSLKRIFEKGLLVQDHRVSPYCPRCGTGLSDHELAQGYEDVTDASVYVKFPITSGPLLERFPGISLLVWTTTPWTLVSNTAAAVNPKVSYEISRTSNGEVFIVAQQLRESVLGEDSIVLDTVLGADLEGTTYERPFDWVEFPETDAPIHSVLVADYVTTEDGTGIVHQSPAFGAEDMQICRRYGLPVVNPVEPNGEFNLQIPEVGGVFFKTADLKLVEILQTSGKLYRHLPYEHSYPHCWRCHTALIYYAQPSWYIKTTAIKDQLLEANEKTNWFPETIKNGRFGDWLNNNVDWALSRNRYWGTPLPIWRCDESHLTCVGGRTELAKLAGDQALAVDPHRPFVDEITFPCPECGLPANRVPEVIDCWFDSGAMPFAQYGYPKTNADIFEVAYPADFICEAIDQTRGWFYTLMAIGTLVFDQSAYQNVLCLGHILDEDGRKMSKHLGNVLEPIPLMDEHGADALRWFMAVSGSPWQARRVGHTTIAEVVRKTLLTYWNTVAFQSLYARSSNWDGTQLDFSNQSDLDKWAISEAYRLARDVDNSLEHFDTQKAGRLIAEYVDDLSNWYVRRSRRRFWDGDFAALSTLHRCLKIVTQVMAPFTPFITERVWQDLFVTNDETSVHLTLWPDWQGAQIDDDLRDQVALTRRIVELGRAARATSGVKTRQPLQRALVAATGWSDIPESLQEQIRDEVNVLALEELGESSELVEVTVKANFKSLGARFGKQTPEVAKAISEQPPAEFVAALRSDSAVILIGGQEQQISLDDVVITEAPREGWTVASADGESLALDLALTDDLIAQGIARDITRMIQDARKSAGFDISDRIQVTWNANSRNSLQALTSYGDKIAAEVLATTWKQGDTSGATLQDDELGVSFTLTKA
ncbi:MAG: isoleucine--tRNA ligase [Actinobacteria bacterium]|nr:isoleucine--tRNA ligase [Actinomycetota bacterium]